ncbi:MAG: MATE family efflux transporter [Methanobacteriaceae archaeon]|nr:MATE family efflux transporter [Methanobacteriaceae archaeon]
MIKNSDEIIDKQDLMNLNPQKAFKKMAPPLAIYAIFDAICSLINTLWAGALGSDVVAAVAIASPIFLFITVIGKSMGKGTNSFMSRKLGSKHEDNELNEEDITKIETAAHNIIIHGIIICIIGSIISFIIGLVGLSSLTSNSLAISYLSPLFILGFLSIFSQFFPETLQAKGVTKIPNAVLSIGLILNIILDPILAINFNLGIVGLAYATIVASLIPFITFMYMYLKDEKYASLKLKHFEFKAIVLYEILKVSIPTYIDNTTGSISSTYINQTLTIAGGSLALSIYSYTKEIRSLMLSPSRGLARGVSSIGGHLYGAKKHDDIKSIYFYAIKETVLLGIISSIAIFILSNILLSSLAPELNSMKWEITALLIVLCFLSPIIYVSANLLNGLGLSIYTLIMSILSMFITIICIDFLKQIFDSLLAVLIGIGLSDIIIVIIYITLISIIVKRRKRKHNNQDNT